MDFGELGPDADEKATVPTRPFQLAAHGSFARLQPGQIQRQLPQQRQVIGAMPLPVPRLILVAGHIQRPAQPVLNPPMPPHNIVEPFRRAGFVQQIVAALFAPGPVLPPDGGHFAHDTILDQSQARPVMRFPQPSHIDAGAGVRLGMVARRPSRCPASGVGVAEGIFTVPPPHAATAIC